MLIKRTIALLTAAAVALACSGVPAFASDATPAVPGGAEGAGPAAIALAADPQAVQPGGTSTLTAAVRDASGQPVAGVQVDFSATAGSVDPASAVTDAEGKAVSTFTAPQDPGDVAVTATVHATDLAASASVSVVQAQVPEYDFGRTVVLADGKEYQLLDAGFWYSAVVTLRAWSDLALRFPCAVNVVKKTIFFIAASVTVMDPATLWLEQDAADPAVVHIRPVLCAETSRRLSGIDRVGWPAGQVRLGLPDFALRDCVVPADGGKWANLKEIRINAECEALPVTLLASYPRDGDTILVNPNGVVGYPSSSIYYVSGGRDTPMGFWFAQPVKVDRSRIVVRTESSAGAFEGNLGNVSLVSAAGGSYEVAFSRVFAPGFFGHAQLVDGRVTITFLPGAVQVLNGAANDEPITVSFRINPSPRTENTTAENPAPPEPAGPPRNAAMVWSRKIEGKYFLAPVKGAGVVYLAGDGLYCFDDRDGMLLWSVPGEFSRPVLLPDGALAVVYRELYRFPPGSENPADEYYRYYLRCYNADGSLRWEAFIPGHVGAEPNEMFGGVLSYFTERNNVLQVTPDGNIQVYCIAALESIFQSKVRAAGLATYSPDGVLLSLDPAAPRPQEHVPQDTSGLLVATRRFAVYADAEGREYFREIWYPANDYVADECVDYLLGPEGRVELGGREPEDLGYTYKTTRCINFVGTSPTPFVELDYQTVKSLTARNWIMLGRKPYGPPSNIGGFCYGSLYAIHPVYGGETYLVKFDEYPAGPQPVRVEVRPAEATVEVGKSVRFQAVAVYEDGSEKDVTAECAWEVSDDSVAFIDRRSAPNVVEGLKPGQVTVTATWYSALGLIGQAVLAVVEATGPSPQTFVVLPPEATVKAGGSVQFQAVVIFTDGSQKDVTSEASWSVADPSVASVAGGLATGLKAGETDVVATWGGLTGRARLAVEPQAPQPVGLRVEPKEATVRVGEAVQYRATAAFADGSERDVTYEAAWLVSDPQVAVVAAGRATGLKAGQVDVVASWQNLTGRANLTVTARPSPVRLEVRPAEATANVGETRQYRAFVVYSDGTEEDVTERCSWDVKEGAEFAVCEGAKGLFRGKKAGRVIVRATIELP